MNCNTTHYRANSSSVPGDPTLEWQRGAAEDEKRTMRLLDELEEKKTPIVRAPPKWKEDLGAWWGRARKNPAAWVPEVPKKK